MSAQYHLPTYINDHLAESVAGIELARRCLSNNKGTELGDFLEKLISILEKEQALLKEVLAGLGESESSMKKSAAWIAEKFGRLKLNDSIFSYSDLSRVHELEFLVMGLQGQSRMWRVLEAFCSDDSNFQGLDFKSAAETAEAMLAETAQHHFEAARTAFTAEKQEPVR